MQLALAKRSGDERPLQERIAAELRAMILDGRLRPGERLPGSRALAADLGVSRTTVVLALERLASEGYLESRARIGLFVAASPPEGALVVARVEPAGPRVAPARATPVPAPPLLPVVRRDQPRPELDFWVGRADPALFPLRAWREAVEAKLARAGSALAEYLDPQGEPSLREAIAARVGPARGIRATAEEVVVVSGSQDGINLACRMLGGGGRCFVHEDPCYRGAFELFVRSGMRRVAVPVDADGLRPEALPDQRGCLLYLTPSHQYPLGVTLSLERRRAVLDWAERTDSFVLEDDYDGDFCYDEAPLPALAAEDRMGRVLYLATFSKSLGPGLRLGYLIVPPQLCAAARAWKALMSIGVPWLEQAAMTELLLTGAFERHLRRIRLAYRARRDRLIARLEASFGPQEIQGRRGGMHLAWRLPPAAPAAEAIERAAARVGVGVYGLRSAGAWASPGHPRLRDTLLFGYAALDEAQIDTALERLAAVLPRLARHAPVPA